MIDRLTAGGRIWSDGADARLRRPLIGEDVVVGLINGRQRLKFDAISIGSSGEDIGIQR